MLRKVRLEGSSAIDDVGYNDETEQLFLHFIDTDTVWVYEGVPLWRFGELIAARSVGRYFNAHIRNRYSARRAVLTRNSGAMPARSENGAT